MAPEPTRREGIRYRPALGAQDEEAFVGILQRSFAIPVEGARSLWRRLDGDVRVLADASDVVACLGWYDFGQWFGGRSVRCAGIAAVGVEPHRRRAGLASRIVTDALRELTEADVPLATLYPSNLPLYRAAGFEVAGGRYEVRVRCADLPNPKALAPVVPLRDGIADPRVRRLYARVAATRNGWIDRNDSIWERVHDFRGEVREGFGVERGDEIAGYVFLARKKRREWGFDVVCGDLVAEDGDAGRALLGFLGGHGTIAVEAIANIAPTDPFVALLTHTPERHRLHHPWMLRVLDVRAAIEARGYAVEVRGTVEIEVEDALLARNSGRFVVQVEGGSACVTPGGAGRVRVRVRALGPLFSAHATAETLAFAGLVEGPARELATLSALFAGSPPTTADFF